jgi:hypothetical protein
LSCRSGELDEEGDAGIGGDGEASAEGLDALAHAAEAVALLKFRMSAVVGDEQGMVAIGGVCETHAAVRGLGVTNDVGDGFADGEAEYGLFCGVKFRQWGFAGEGYACGLEGVAG